LLIVRLMSRRRLAKRAWRRLASSCFNCRKVLDTLMSRNAEVISAAWLGTTLK